jgi:hypothetical protein
MTIFKQNGRNSETDNVKCHKTQEACILFSCYFCRNFDIFLWYILIFSCQWYILFFLYTFQGVIKEFIKSFLFSRAFQLPLKMNFNSRSIQGVARTLWDIYTHAQWHCSILFFILPQPKIHVHTSLM